MGEYKMKRLVTLVNRSVHDVYLADGKVGGSIAQLNLPGDDLQLG